MNAALREAAANVLDRIAGQAMARADYDLRLEPSRGEMNRTLTLDDDGMIAEYGAPDRPAYPWVMHMLKGVAR